MKAKVWDTQIGYRAADLLSACGILLFAIQLVIHAHFQVPVMDEGLYLYKGLQFVSGRYQPFQDYGPLTNQMPFAFLIPGTVQFLFGPGLRAGRYFAVLLSLFMILGLWLTSRRLTNPWLAAGAVWVIALIPAVTKIYSMAISEGLIACLLVWVMALTLGEKRQLWQLVVGSILAGFIVMIRINLLPLLPLLCLYILWQNGWKSAAWATLAGALTVAITHAIYWPNILRLWAYWLPERLVPFLKAWRPPLDAPPFWNPTITLSVRLNSLIDGVRFNFISVMGALTTWALWPRKSAWKNPAQYRIAVFLSALFFSLLILHAWASLIQNYCVFCFPIYTSFFACLGVLLTVVTIDSWQTRLNLWRWLASGLVVIAVFSGIGFSRISGSFIRMVMKLPVPRTRSMRFLPGNVELQQMIANKFHLELEALVPIFSVIIPVLFGILCFGLCLLIAFLLPRLFKRLSTGASAGASVLIFILLAGWVLSPTVWLGNGYHRYDCEGDVLAADELAGEALQKAVPPQAKIFWRGISPVTLLHLPQAKIYPAQLNGDYSYRLGGEPDELLRYGWWDKSLGLQWAKEADYILVAQKYDKGWVKDILESGDYQEITIFPNPANRGYSSCLTDVYPRVFTKKP
jgi:hypothetical protein